MDAETRRSVYTAVTDFVGDLEELPMNKNAKKSTPYNLYRRLLTHVKIDENDGSQMDKFTKGFVKFFKVNKCYLESDKELLKMPEKTSIFFSERVYLEIQKFIKYLEKEERENLTIIRQHLLTIYAIIKPSEEAFSALEESTDGASKMLKKMGFDKKSKEGQLVSNIVDKAQNVIECVDSSDPQDAIMALFASGGISDIVESIKNGAEDENGGGINMQTLLAGLQNAMGQVVTENKIVEEK